MKSFSSAIITTAITLFVSTGSHASTEFDPYAPNARQILREFDRAYEDQTGLSPFLDNGGLFSQSTCYRSTCRVWVHVSKAEQALYLYLDGYYSDSWYVSTGVAGRTTPNFDRHPNGRIYDRYTSSRYPGGDYRGLGNMPYAIFIEGGFALHGTPRENWRHLGRRASHGCIRQHPDQAYYLNRLVRSAGIHNVWITVN